MGKLQIGQAFYILMCSAVLGHYRSSCVARGGQLWPRAGQVTGVAFSLVYVPFIGS